MPDTTTLPLAPMTAHAVISAFSYLRAVQAGDVEAAREFAGTEPRMAELLVDTIERIVVPVTACPARRPASHTEMFALEALGQHQPMAQAVEFSDAPPVRPRPHPRSGRIGEHAAVQPV
ncbi:hypothetical protein ACFWIN_00375 [Streptomyces sp. NPDC127049]|uniref:hypothetical protein n=1 Tax=Streptomyces sp. NPDC127049 TaxID=3347118 RepID=UPI0036604BA4